MLGEGVWKWNENTPMLLCAFTEIIYTVTCISFQSLELYHILWLLKWGENQHSFQIIYK